MERTIANRIRTISEVGIFAAIGYVLDELQGALSKGLFINGGSIGFAMIAVLIIAYRRGWLPAILTGLIMGLLDIATSAYILHPLQLFLDYIFPYAFVGIAGLLKPFFDKYQNKTVRVLWLISGAVIGGLLKFTSHYIAGVVFWADPKNFAWGLSEMNVYLYCFIYNIAFIGPSIILTGALLVMVFLKAPRVLLANQIIIEKVELEKKKDLFSILESIIYIVTGSFCFIFFLIRYILSFSDYTDSGAYGYDFDGDSMIIFILGLMMLVLGINSIFATLKERHSYKLSLAAAITILSCSLIYGIANLTRSYVKSKDPTTYWIWIGIGTLTLAIAITILLIKINKEKKMGN